MRVLKIVRTKVAAEGADKVVARRESKEIHDS